MKQEQATRPTIENHTKQCPSLCLEYEHPHKFFYFYYVILTPLIKPFTKEYDFIHVRYSFTTIVILG